MRGPRFHYEIVAAIALERGCTLMTDNRKDFPMPELVHYSPPEE